MLRNNPPPRNRLLALEQELQTRQSPGFQKAQHDEAPHSIDQQAQAWSVNPTPIPSRNSQPPQTQHTTSPPSSPWQALAARLGHSQPVWNVALSTEASLTQPWFDQNIHHDQNFTQRTVKTSRRSSSPPERLPPVTTFPPHIADAIPPNISDNAQPSGSWQDLAAQLRQTRSPQPRSRSSSPFLPNSQTQGEPSELDDFTHLNLPALPAQPESISFSITDITTTVSPFQEILEADIEEWEENDQVSLPSISTAATLDVTRDETCLESWQNLAAQLHQARLPLPQPRSSTPLLPAARNETELIEIIDDSDFLSLPPLPAQPESTSFLIAAALIPDAIFHSFLEAEIEERKQNDKQINFAITSAITKITPTSSAIVLVDKPTEAAIAPVPLAETDRALLPQIQEIPKSRTITPETTRLSLVMWRSPQLRQFLPWLIFPAWFSLASLLPQFL